MHGHRAWFRADPGAGFSNGGEMTTQNETAKEISKLQSGKHIGVDSLPADVPRIHYER